MVERIECKAPGCERTILPTTAAETGGLCMPCHLEATSREQRAWGEANRVHVDRFAGLDDPVAIALKLVEPAPRDELVVDVPYPRSLVDVVGAMAPRARAALLDRAEMLLRDPDPALAERGKRLAAVLARWSVDIGDAQRALAAGQDLEPSLFWRAPDDVVAMLLARTSDADRPDDRVLVSLAWTQRPAAIRAFAQWQATPPPWAGELFVPIADYLHAGGIEIQNRVVRRLYEESCRELTNATEVVDDRGQGDGVEFLVDGRSACGFCGDALTVLIAIEQPARWLPSLLATVEDSWERLAMPVCERCSCYGNLFFDVGRDGSFCWASENVRPAFLPVDEAIERLPTRSLQLGARRPPAAAANWCGDVQPRSQLGGLPAWIQDAAYPSCPSCHRTMPFVGQLAIEDVSAGEGMHYAFLCAPCGKTATVYQQT